MGRLRRYRTAFKRYRHGKGFGIHSPFAFGFVLKVLRERLPYYAYEQLETLRAMVISRTRHHFRHPRIISLKNVKLIFRVANFFNPQAILQVGTSYGVSSASLLSVSSRSRLILCEPHIDRYPVAEEILADYASRITLTASLGDAISAYSACLTEVSQPTDLADETPAEQASRRAMQPFVLINNVETETELHTLLPYLRELARGNATIIVRNLSRNPLMRTLWAQFSDECRHGMSFSNDRIAIFVANVKLPRQDFAIWF
ncbi:MAG: hypothetical protein ACI4UN_09875 [Muribaculaceae bacterium]